MKKLNFFLGIGVAALALFFNSCSDTTHPAPTITFDNDSIVLAAGDSSATLTGTINAEAGLDQVTVYKVTSSSETQVGSTYSSFKSGDITTTDDINYNFRITVSDITENMSIKISTIDKDKQTASKSIKVYVTPASGNQINEFTAVMMGAQSNTSAGSTASLTTGKVYTISGGNAKSNSASVDIVYYYGSKNAALYSPSQSDIQNVTAYGITSWSTINNTKLSMSSISSSTFDAITDDSGISSAGTPSSDVVPDLAVNDVVVFQTASGKMGVFKVTNVQTGSTGSITIDVKVQK